MDIQNVKSIAFVSHPHAGKTSLVDSLLFATGANTRRGSPQDGSSMCDTGPDEIERKMTIDSKILSVEKDGYRINFIDAPGFADFLGSIITSLHAAECGLCIVCGHNGVEIGTSRVWDLMAQANKPAFLFVNKLDKEKSSFEETVSSIQEELGKNCIPIAYPVGKESSFSGVVSLLDTKAIDGLPEEEKAAALKYRESLIETIAEIDDALVEKYLGGEELTDQEIINGLKQSVIARKIHPIFCGSAANGIGEDLLIEGIKSYFPSLCDVRTPEAKSTDSDEAIAYKVSADEPFAAQVFKTVNNPFSGKITFFKVFSGSLTSNSSFINVNKGVKERIGHIYLPLGKQHKEIDEVQAGDIAAVTKLKTTGTGSSLGTEKRQLLFPALKLPEPAISLSLKPKTRQDEEKIMEGLQKLASEDPTFKFGRDPQTKELVVSGLGDLHLKIMIERLKKTFHVETEIGTPKVAYKETIRKKVQSHHKHKKQSGGHGQYGEVYLEIEPLPRGEEYEFVNKIVGGSIPKQYIPGVEKGVKSALEAGVLLGAPVVDIRVKVYDGSFHTVDSSEMAFKIAAGTAMREGLRQANPVVLEPITDVEVIVPEDALGAINRDLNSRRGRVMGMEAKGSNQVIKAQVPLAEMLKYATELRSITAGQGSYTMKFSHYEENNEIGSKGKS